MSKDGEKALKWSDDMLKGSGISGPESVNRNAVLVSFFFVQLHFVIAPHDDSNKRAPYTLP